MSDEAVTSSVLVIDQVEQAALPIRVYGDTSSPGWTTTVATSVAALQALDSKPDLVLLHIGDGGQWQADDMLKVIRFKGWSELTALVTGQNAVASKHLAELQTKYGLRAVIPRPVNFGLIEDWLNPEFDAHSTSPTTNLVWQTTKRLGKKFLIRSGARGVTWLNAANQLEPAVVVFKTTAQNKIPQLELQNAAAKAVNDGVLSAADHRRITLLQAKLADDVANGGKGRRAKCLDWDVEKGEWVECRLHPLDGDGLFWYTRDWRGPKAIDEEFAHFEDERFFLTRFDRLCDYLAERWAITRVRLYQIDRLPCGLGHFPVASDEGRRDELPTLVMVEPLVPGGIGLQWLIVPRAQSGSGWADDRGNGEPGSAEAWWNHVFCWPEFVAAASDGTHQREQLSPDAANNAALFEQVGAGNPAHCQVDDTPTVGWGDAGHRLIDVFPGLVRPEDRAQGASASAAPVVLSAMLAMDRRRDHLQGDLNHSLTEPAREMPRMRLAARGGRLEDTLDQGEADALIGGPLPEIRKRLGRWLIDDQERRVRKWHGVVSRAIQDSFSQVYGQGGMPALSRLCGALMAQWPTLWKHETKRVGISAPPTSIGAWFFVTERTLDRMDMPAGAGPIWDQYQQESHGFLKSVLVKRLMAEGVPDWTFLAVQDYQQWRQSDAAQPDQAQQAGYEAKLDKVKTWVGIKLPGQPGFAAGLMVVHIVDTKNAAWASVLHLLVVTAQRLYPPFMLALSEQHERTAWAAAVVHEIKTDALLLQQRLKAARDTPAAFDATLPRLLDLAHGIGNLSRDYLSTLDERFDRPLPEEEATATVDVAEQLTVALAPWLERYPHMQCEKDFGQMGSAAVQLKAHRLWRRVVRVLLHNGFRHGRERVTVRAISTGAYLQVTVVNLATDEAVRQLRASEASNTNDLNPAFARMRVGLRNARLLCKASGAKIYMNTTPRSDSAGRLFDVTHNLSWPLATPSETAMGGD